MLGVLTVCHTRPYHAGAQISGVLQRWQQFPEWQRILVLLISSRVALVVAASVALAMLPMSSRHLGLLPELPWLQPWAQWDAQHYVAIAVSGYETPEQSYSNVAFFPLYPLLMRLLAAPFGPVTEQSAALAGLVISNVALFLALLYLSKLVARDLTLSVAQRSVLYMAVFPTTLFLSSVYAESLFLLLAVASLYHARKGEWYLAGGAAFLAALTRPFGLLLIVPLAVELLRQRASPRAWPSLVLPPAGLIIFFGYLWWLFGDPLAYFEAGEQGWDRGLNPPWETLAAYAEGPLQLFDWPYAWVDLLSMAVMLVLVRIGWRLLPTSYSAYATVALVFALSAGEAWFSASRHALAIFPVMVVLALMGERRSFNLAWLAFSSVVALAFMARVAVGYWAA